MAGVENEHVTSATAWPRRPPSMTRQIGGPARPGHRRQQPRKERRKTYAYGSNHLRTVGYDPDTALLRLEFYSGGLYEYAGVSVALYEQLLLPHPWRRVGRLVRGCYPTHRIRAA